MRYKPGIMVSFISIFEASKLVASITAFEYVVFAWEFFFFPYFTLVVDIVSWQVGHP
jgi:hypothetical protein